MLTEIQKGTTALVVGSPFSILLYFYSYSSILLFFYIFILLCDYVPFCTFYNGAGHTGQR